MNSSWQDRLSREPDEHLIHLSEFFVLVLIGVAYEATIEPVGELLRGREDKWPSALLLGTFVLTTFRFLVGNYRHLNKPETRATPRIVLLFDMFWIGLESLVMVFLGTFTSVKNNREALEHGYAFNYLGALVALSVIDMIWIWSRLSLAALPKVQPRMLGFPWNWHLLNLIAIALGGWALHAQDRDGIVNTSFIAMVFIGSAILFVVDVLDILEEPEPKGAAQAPDDMSARHYDSG